MLGNNGRLSLKHNGHAMSKKEVIEEPPPPPLKHDSFRKYLEDGCVLDSLARVLVALYEAQEFPADPKEFIRTFLSSPQGVDVESLQRENNELKDEIKKCETRIQELKGQTGFGD
jgi:hypothetical protein